MRAGTVPSLVGLLGVGAVAGAFRPPLRRWPWSVLGALPSAIASEVPSVLIAAHGLAGPAALRGRGWVRVAALASNAAGLAGAVVLAGDARRSAAVLEDALREAGVLGSAPPATRRPCGVRSGRVARGRHRRVADVRYGGPGTAGLLDIWHRHGLPADGRAPVLLQVHGGAWSSGDKRGQAEPLLGYLAERGWVCVTVNYRLAPEHRWPDMIVDVKRAIAWTREHIAGYGGDPGFLAVTGGSAGAHLAALAAVSPGDPDYQPGFPEADTRVAAAVALYGVFDFTRERQGLWRLLERRVIGTRYAEDPRTWQQASPLLRVGPDTPPFLVVHGSTDAVVGVEQSRRFVAALRERSPAPVGYAELPRAQHGFDGVPTARTAYTVAAAHRFLTAVHESYLTSRTPAAAPGRWPPACRGSPLASETTVRPS